LHLSIEDIREILRIFVDSELQDLRLEIDNVRLALSKSGATAAPPPPPSPPSLLGTAASAAAPVVAAPAAAAAAAAAPAAAGAARQDREGLVVVAASSVGVFYRRPSPDQPPFVEIGSEVEAEDPLCLIEVMKMFTGVSAPCRGRVAEILVEDATMVEYGQPLMSIEPA
jgi:acetyl-CoA carboxylase biotin carboxyl carrier protein